MEIKIEANFKASIYFDLFLKALQYLAPYCWYVTSWDWPRQNVTTIRKKIENKLCPWNESMENSSISPPQTSLFSSIPKATDTKSYGSNSLFITNLRYCTLFCYHVFALLAHPNFNNKFHWSLILYCLHCWHLPKIYWSRSAIVCF